MRSRPTGSLRKPTRSPRPESPHKTRIGVYKPAGRTTKPAPKK